MLTSFCFHIEPTLHTYSMEIPSFPLSLPVSMAIFKCMSNHVTPPQSFPSLNKGNAFFPPAKSYFLFKIAKKVFTGCVAALVIFRNQRGNDLQGDDCCGLNVCDPPNVEVDGIRRRGHWKVLRAEPS